LLAIVEILLYQMIALHEERELLDGYGPEYQAYVRAVPRFVPRWRRKAEPQIFP
jgi:protein-S-isoprenylcysteine O-methyltransferase Ste14